MSDIAMIGSIDQIQLFGLLGLDLFPAENASEARGQLSHLIEEKSHKVVFIMEGLACEMRDEMREAEFLDEPVVSPLPDHIREVCYIDDELRRLSKSAIGMEV